MSRALRERRVAVAAGAAEEKAVREKEQRAAEEKAAREQEERRAAEEKAAREEEQHADKKKAAREQEDYERIKAVGNTYLHSLSHKTPEVAYNYIEGIIKELASLTKYSNASVQRYLSELPYRKQLNAEKKAAAQAADEKARAAKIAAENAEIEGAAAHILSPRTRSPSESTINNVSPRSSFASTASTASAASTRKKQVWGAPTPVRFGGKRTRRNNHKKHNRQTKRLRRRS